ncbi:hypothetical protein [Nocardia thraciensis]
MPKDFDITSSAAASPDSPPHCMPPTIASRHPGLVYTGVEFQRSFASDTLRSVQCDAEHVAAALAGEAGAIMLAAG